MFSRRISNSQVERRAKRIIIYEQILAEVNENGGGNIKFQRKNRKIQIYVLKVWIKKRKKRFTNSRYFF